MDQDYDLGKDMYFPVAKGSGTYPSKRKKVIEEPVIIWRPEYEKNPAKFLDLIQNISDYMLLNGAGLYDDDNRNKPHLFNIAKGIINPKDYEEAEFAYGFRGNTPIRNNDFFYESRNHTLSELIQQPFKFQLDELTNEYTNKKKIKKDLKTAKKLMKTLLAQSMKQDEGVNMDFMQDEDVNVQGESADDILNKLFGQDQLALVMHKIIQSLNWEHDIHAVLNECFENKYDINSEFAFIDVVNGDVIPRHVHPDNVRWISGKPVKTFEDKSVKAASIINYLTPSELVNDYINYMDTGTGVQGLIDAIDKITEGKRVIYDPRKPYFSSYVTNSTAGSNYLTEDVPNSGLGRMDYFRDIFYPYRKAPYGVGTSILEQKIFFKMFVPKRYVVEINGKPATDKTFKQWKEENWNRDLNANFTEIGTDEKAPKGSYVINKHKQELWQATRLGHATIVNAGRYEHSVKTQKKETYVGMPIIAQISRDPSIVAIGENVVRRVNVIESRIEDIINRMGANSALAIDEAVMNASEAKAGLFNARKAGILMFNSNKMSGNAGLGPKHFDIVKFGNEIEEMNNLFSMMGFLTEGYKRKIGTSSQVTGGGSPYESEGQQQQNIASQNQLKGIMYWQHGLFANQVLQRTADIAKNVLATGETRSVRLDNGQVEILKLSKEMSLRDYDIKLRFGDQEVNKMRDIKNSIRQVIPSGGIDMIGDLLKMLWMEDPTEALAMLDKTKESMALQQAKNQEAQMQQIQAETQLAQAKAQVPVQVATIQTQSAQTIQQMKMQNEREKEDFKGSLSDIAESNEREKMLMGNNLEQGKLEKQTDLEARLEQMRQMNAQPQAPQPA